MKINAAIFAVLLALLSGEAAAREVAGVQVAETARVDDTALVLNGAGVRSKFFVKVYVGALYLPKRAAQAVAILSVDTPWSVHMHFVHSEVEAKKLVDAWNDGFEANLAEADRERLAQQIAAFDALFRTMRKGETIRIDYSPTVGTRVTIQNEVRGTIPGADFGRAVLSIWLGEKPADTSLKRAMLGGD